MRALALQLKTLDYIFDALARYGRTYEAIEFMVGDNAYVNGKLVDLISTWLWREKRIRRTVPLIGCAAHRLALAVKRLLSHESHPEWISLIKNCTA